MARPAGLGRGLSSLIPTIADNEGSSFRSVPIGAISPNRYQPRRHFEEESLISLAESIAALGVLQPILLRQLDSESYELIAGERRWRAARRAGLDVIPALVQEADDVSSLEQAVVENLHRENLNPLEEAAAYRQLIDDFGLTHEELSKRMGKSRAAVTNTLRILQLPAGVQRQVAEGSLSAGHARALLGLSDRSEQERLAKRIVDEELSVREVEERVRRARESVQGEEGLRLSERAHKKVLGSAEALPNKPAGVVELEDLLGNALDTVVKVDLSKPSRDGVQGGRISISFGSLDDLERLFRRILD
jgi:ParB family chromosome partitioning protein